MKVSQIPWSAALALAFAAAGQQPSPTYIPQTKFARGQDVVPSFDGWIKNADGTFSMVFGYLNRNYEEELTIPAGPDNKLDPLAEDSGQPTYFLPRRHARMFRVKVPADWGNRELVWSITAHGRTEKAYGSLMSAEEITERMVMTNGNLSPGLDDPNQPPSIALSPVEGATVGQPLTLTALVTDDGLPKPRAMKALSAVETGKSQTNTAPQRPIGLAVSWMQYRGPAKAVFERTSAIPVTGGEAVTRVSFPAPGTYVLRATASDGELSVPNDVVIVVSSNQGK
jgi:hypothetical protein